MHRSTRDGNVVKWFAQAVGSGDSRKSDTIQPGLALLPAAPTAPGHSGQECENLAVEVVQWLDTSDQHNNRPQR